MRMAELFEDQQELRQQQEYDEQEYFEYLQSLTSKEDRENEHIHRHPWRIRVGQDRQPAQYGPGTNATDPGSEEATSLPF